MKTWKRRAVAVGAALALVVPLAACGGNRLGGQSSAGGESVPVGADKEAFQEALADMEPVELKIQAPGNKGGASARAIENYTAAVSDWSGGRITFEIIYGYAIATPPDEADAVSDGLLSISGVYGFYDPSRYPASSALIDAIPAGDNARVTGDLQAAAAILDIAWQTPDVSEEYEERGIHLLAPMIANSTMALLCADPATTSENLAGRQVGVSGTLQLDLAKSLGMTPVSMPGVEAFEALERGVIDCQLTSLSAAHLYGFLAKAHFVLNSPKTPLGRNPMALGVNAAAWSRLPLAGQQLLHDRIDVYIETLLKTDWSQIETQYADVTDNGGNIVDLDTAAQEALAARANERLDNAGEEWDLSNGGDYAELVRSTMSTWADTVSGLGYEPHTFADLAESGGEDIDLTDYLDAVRTQILDKHRPGA